MGFQGIIVALVIVAAVAFAGRSLLQKRRAFSPKGDCGPDCGCGK